MTKIMMKMHALEKGTWDVTLSRKTKCPGGCVVPTWHHCFTRDIPCPSCRC